MMKPGKHPVRLRAYKEYPSTAYVELIDHPPEIRGGMVSRSISVDSLIQGYDGPKITIDFDANGIAIGIEIIYPFDYAQDEDPEDPPVSVTSNDM